jgi:chromosome segregation ATPase
MLQQAAAEKSRLQAENAALAGEKEQLSKGLESLKSTLAGLETRLRETEGALAGAKESNAELTQRLDETLERLHNLAAKHREQGRVLQVTEGSRARLEATSAEQAHRIEDLESKNLKLYGIDRELVERYDKKGVWEAIQEGEPFTGLKQVEMENLLEEYRDRMDALKAAKAAP